MNNGFFNWPKFNWKAIPRIAKWAWESGPQGKSEEDWTWYDKQGNTVNADPYTQNEIYDATGKRYVYWRGDWAEDDPTAWRAYKHPLTGLLMNAATSPNIYTSWETPVKWVAGQIVEEPLTWAQQIGRINTVGTKVWGISRVGGKLASDDWEAMQERYMHMTPSGEYVKGYDDNGKPILIPKGTWQWVLARWGDNPPTDVVDKFMSELDAKYPDPDVYDASPYETKLLNNPDSVLANLGLNVQQQMQPQNTLVRVGGPRQYAITLPGEGDRWKYVIQKDHEGNWVKVYRRTYGAKKEKEMALKKKGKWEEGK